MASIGDVYQIVDSGTMIGQKVLNVYFYKLVATPAGFVGAEDVAQAYVDQVLPDVVAIQTADVLHQSVKATNLFDETDAHEILVSEPGVAGSDSQGTFEAYPFRLVGDNAAVRAGAKRYPGVEDSFVSDGVVTDVDILALLNDLADKLADTLTFGIGVSLLDPVIVKRILLGGNYTLPTTPEDAILSVVTDVLFDTLVTSQVSRKVGRGE